MDAAGPDKIEQSILDLPVAGLLDVARRPRLRCLQGGVYADGGEGSSGGEGDVGARAGGAPDREGGVGAAGGEGGWGEDARV